MEEKSKMDTVLVKQVRRVTGGYIVEARWPVGDSPGAYGEVICRSMDEVLEVLKRCDEGHDKS